MNIVETVVGSGMKLTCSRDELVQALGVVSRGVSSRGAVQILAGILLRAEGGSLQLAATDMELSLRTTFDAQVKGEGATVVPGRLLVDLARLLPDTQVVFEHKVEENTLEVVCGPASYRLRTYAVEDFPRLPETTGAALHAVKTEPLLETIARVGRAASRDESRPVLTGILARFEAGKLIMAATDSYRLSVKETPLEGEIPDLEAIIPARALEELRRIAGGTEEVGLGVQDNQVVFGVDGICLTTRRIDGQVPTYKQPDPEQVEPEVTMPPEELLEVVRRTSVMAERNSPLRLRFAEGELTLSAQTQDVGESKETLPAPFAGEPLEIGFNPQFLRDGLESVEGDQVVLRRINPLRPAVLGGSGGGFLSPILPTRLPG